MKLKLKRLLHRLLASFHPAFSSLIAWNWRLSISSSTISLWILSLRSGVLGIAGTINAGAVGAPISLGWWWPRRVANTTWRQRRQQTETCLVEFLLLWLSRGCLFQDFEPFQYCVPESFLTLFCSWILLLLVEVRKTSQERRCSVVFFLDHSSACLSKLHSSAQNRILVDQ